MNFRSPWQGRIFVAGVGFLRRLLRPWPRMETLFIRLLVDRQNRRVLNYVRTHPVQSILLILPRCVKRQGCRCDVRESLQDCLTCRECPLGATAQLTHEYGVRALVAFRSHIAYAMARQERPDLIIAAACDDRLIKALRSVPEIPAFLTPLRDMERPCRGANFDLDWVETHLHLACRPRTPGRARAAAAGSQKEAIRPAEGL